MSDRPQDDPRVPLRLVPSATATAAPANDAPAAADAFAEPTDDEIRAAEALRDALDLREGGAEGGVGADGAALRAAFSPATLSHEDHERLLERVLGVEHARPATARAGLPEAALAPPATRAEERAAGALRTRIDAGLRPDPDAEPDDEVERLVEVAIALRSAHAPRALDDISEARIRKGALASPRRRFRIIATTVTALAVAAAAILALVPRVGPGRAPATASLVPARSTQELFDPAEPFPREGGASARIDRISAARSADLRQNRFARWGVK